MTQKSEAPKSGTQKSETTSSDVLGALPETSQADTLALRRARGATLDPDRASRAASALRQPSYAELARRPITEGEPFRL